jgi:Na+/H+-translocating membrane pyrophosphatase
MNTLDILTYICEKREEFVVNGLNAQDALENATHAIAKEYHICSVSITKLVTLL